MWPARRRSRGSATSRSRARRWLPHPSQGHFRVAGFAGKSFDAEITGFDVPKYCKTHVCGKGVSLEPFMTNHHCGFCTNTMHRETQDVKYGALGQIFRIIVLNARGKVVVIYLESIYADQKKFPPAKLFPTFLPYAQKLLGGISFS